MALRSMTVHRYEEIRRRLAEGRSLHEIARALGCSRRTVREVRDGERLSPDAPKSTSDPLWMAQLDWPAIIHDLGLGHPLKFLWERSEEHTSELQSPCNLVCRLLLEENASSAGMVDAGFENQKELTKLQLDNQKEIAEMQNETQKEIAGIQSATSRQNTTDQVYAQNEMLAYQQKESTARVASIMENTFFSKQRHPPEITLFTLTQPQT